MVNVLLLCLWATMIAAAVLMILRPERRGPPTMDDGQGQVKWM